MKSTYKVRVTGAKAFNGNVDGKNYDSTTLFVEVDLASSADGSQCAGYATTSLKFGTSKNFQPIAAHIPGLFEIDSVKSFSGSKVNETITAVRPIAIQKVA